MKLITFPGNCGIGCLIEIDTSTTVENVSRLLTNCTYGAVLCSLSKETVTFRDKKHKQSYYEPILFQVGFELLKDGINNPVHMSNIHDPTTGSKLSLYYIDVNEFKDRYEDCNLRHGMERPRETGQVLGNSLSRSERFRRYRAYVQASRSLPASLSRVRKNG